MVPPRTPSFVKILSVVGNRPQQPARGNPWFPHEPLLREDPLGRRQPAAESARGNPWFPPRTPSFVKILSVVGNRPQFIKSAPLSVALREAGIDEVVVHTGQHWDRELSQVFFDELALEEPAHRLDLHTADPSAMEPPLEAVVRAERPAWVLVYGDTNSTLAGARAASPPVSRSRTSRRACAAATSRCRRSETGSRRTASHRSCSLRTTARGRRSRAKASPARSPSSATSWRTRRCASPRSRALAIRHRTRARTWSRPSTARRTSAGRG